MKQATCPKELSVTMPERAEAMMPPPRKAQTEAVTKSRPPAARRSANLGLRDAEAEAEEAEPTPAEIIFECLAAYQRWKADPTRPKQECEFVCPADCVPPTAADAVADLIADPVRAALRGTVRDIGWRAFTTGGTAEMRRLFDAVHDAAGDTRPAATLDHWWDGIGNDRDRWVA